jgi:hypothetical protein
MARYKRYKVVFSRRWITGRWGYTDRVLNEIGGKPWEPSPTQSAWLVPFEGSSFSLGEYLTEALRIPQSRDAVPGGVFEIEELDPAPPRARPARPSRRGSPVPRTRRLPARPTPAD